MATGYERDAVSISNRVDWLRASANECKAQGAQHYNWFDMMWSTGNYRLNDDQALKAAWLQLAG
jgi:hypothetical protein